MKVHQAKSPTGHRNVELSRTHLSVWAVRVCLSGCGALGLVAVLNARRPACPVLCKLDDRLAVKLGETITGIRGGTTQYSIGSPSKYGIFATMASSSPCKSHEKYIPLCMVKFLKMQRRQRGNAFHRGTMVSRYYGIT